jgi:hypothetical protein
MMPQHKMTPDGESMAKWAMQEPGFVGTVRQLTQCGRCGEPLPPKRHSEPRRYGDIGKPSMHVICDGCFEDLPP